MSVVPGYTEVRPYSSCVVLFNSKWKWISFQSTCKYTNYTNHTKKEKNILWATLQFSFLSSTEVRCKTHIPWKTALRINHKKKQATFLFKATGVENRWVLPWKHPMEQSPWTKIKFAVQNKIIFEVHISMLHFSGKPKRRCCEIISK